MPSAQQHDSPRGRRKRRPYRAPAPAVQPGPIRASERPRIERQQRIDRERAAGARRPAPTVQPGPIRQSERRSIAQQNAIDARRLARQQKARLEVRQEKRRQVRIADRKAERQQLRRAKAQQRQYASQARSVTRQARTSSATGLSSAGRQSLTKSDRDYLRDHPKVRRALQQQAGYVSQGQAVDRAARQPLRRPKPAGGVGNSLLALAGLAAAGKGVPTQSSVLIAKNATKDVGGLITAPFLGGYELGASAWEAAHGDTGRGEKLAKGTWEGLKRGALGRAVQGDFEGALREAVKHPVYSALDVAGGVGAAGRIVGGVARTASRGRLQSTIRPALSISGEPGRDIVERRYSKDAGRRAVQKAADKRRAPVVDRTGKPATVRQGPREVPVLKATAPERFQFEKRRGDQTASKANAAERYARDEAVKQGRDVEGGRVRGRDMRVSKRGRQIVSMVTEGTIRSAKTFEADLRKEERRLSARLAAPGGYENRAERTEAEARLDAVRGTLVRPKAMAQAARIVAQGERHGRELKAQDKRKAQLGLEDPDAMRRAPLLPPAQAHIPGVRHFTEEEHAALEKRAMREEKRARQAADKLPDGPQKTAAIAKVRLLRKRRIEISGRDPAGVERYEGAQDDARSAKLSHEQAKTAVSRAQAKYNRLVGAQTVQRGKRGGPEAPAGAMRGTAAEKRKLAAAKAELDAAKRTEAQARSDRTRAEQAGRDVKLPATQAAMRHGDGRLLSNREIERELKKAGRDPETVAYLPQRADVRGVRAFHSQFRLNRAGPSKDRRTGALYERGASGFGPDLIEETRVRGATQIAKTEQIDKFLHENGLRHPAVAKARAGAKLTAPEHKILKKGGYLNAVEAEKFIRKIADEGGGEYVAVRAFRGDLSADVKAFIAENAQNPLALEGLGTRLLDDALVKPGDTARTRNVLVVQTELVDRLAQHLAPAGGIERVFQILNRPFRFTVLPQPRWLTGNIVEPFLVRLPMAGSGIVNIPGLLNDIRIQAKTVRQMEASSDPRERAAAKEIRAQQFGGLFIGGRGASVRRKATELPGLRGLQVVAATSAGRALSQAMRLLPDMFFRANRQLIEQWAQKAAFGREVRKDIEAFTGSWAKAILASDDALADVRKGLIGTPAQERFMRAQHELLGKYEGFGPTLRKLIQGPFPFLPWMLSASRFVFWTMPAHHTLKTALLVKAQQVIAEAWAEDHEPGEVPPGALRYAPRVKDGGFVDLARYTPWSVGIAMAEGDFGEFTGQAAPQLQGAVKALEGKDPFGRDLKVKPTATNTKGQVGNGQKVVIGLYGLVESMGGPYISMARRLREGGSTAFSDSTVISPKVKPDTKHMSGARRTFDPFRPTYLRAPAGGTAPAPKGRRAGSVDPAVEQALEMQMDPVDLEDISHAMREQTQLDPADLEDIRQALRGG